MLLHALLLYALIMYVTSCSPTLCSVTFCFYTIGSVNAAQCLLTISLHGDRCQINHYLSGLLSLAESLYTATLKYWQMRGICRDRTSAPWIKSFQGEHG